MEITVKKLWQEFIELTAAEIKRAKENGAEPAKLDAIRENVIAAYDYRRVLTAPEDKSQASSN